MLFMNDYDIHRAARVLQNDPAGSEAVRQVAILKEWADSNSDGWAYWPKPVNAAKSLIQLINSAVNDFYRGVDREDVGIDPCDLKAALRPIKAFRTRQGADFQVVEVPR